AGWPSARSASCRQFSALSLNRSDCFMHCTWERNLDKTTKHYPRLMGTFSSSGDALIIAPKAMQGFCRGHARQRAAPIATSVRAVKDAQPARGRNEPEARFPQITGTP